MTIHRTTWSPARSPLEPIRKLLVATALDSSGDALLDNAAALARITGAEVSVVHALEARPRETATELAGLVEERRRLAAAEAARAGLDGDALAEVVVEVATPHDAILAAADRCGAELILLGPTRHGGRLSQILGSTAERMIRQADVPLLICRERLPLPPNRILAPVDLSQTSADAFRCALSFVAQVAGRTRPRVETLLVLSDEQRQSLGVETGIAGHAAEELERFVAGSGIDGGMRIETRVVLGKAPFEILDEARRTATELIVLGTHGHGGLDRLMVGSVALAVAREAPCSVLLVPPAASLGAALAEGVAAQTAPQWE